MAAAALVHGTDEHRFPAVDERAQPGGREQATARRVQNHGQRVPDVHAAVQNQGRPVVPAAVSDRLSEQAGVPTVV